MKFVYCVQRAIRYNDELMLDGVETVCVTEELAKREINKSADHIIEVKDDLGYGKCVWQYFYCDGGGVYHQILTYQNNGTLTYTWRIVAPRLIES